MNREATIPLDFPSAESTSLIIRKERAAASRIWIFATFALVLIYALPIITFPPGRDQGTYLQIGQSLLEGKHLYVDLWDNKPPGIFYAYAVIAKFFGRVMWSVALADILLLLSISYFLFQFAESYLGRVGAAITVIIHAGWHCGMLYYWVAQPETFQTLAVLAAFVMLKGAKRWKLRCFTAGIVTGFGIWQKYNFIAFLPLLMFFPFLDNGALDQQPPRFGLTLAWRPWFARIAFAASGFLLTIVTVMASIVLTGCWPAMRESQFHVLPRYAAMGISQDPHYLLMALYRTTVWLLPDTLFVTLFALVIGWRSRDLKRLLPIFIAAMVALGATVMQVRFHNYYFQVCYPFFAALWAYLGLKLYEGTRSLASRFRAQNWRLAGVLVWIVLANIVFWPVPEQAKELYTRYGEFLEWRSNRELFYAHYPDHLAIELLRGQLDVVHYVQKNTRAGDPIYVWGSNSLIYFLSDRQSPTRFVLNLGVIAKWGEPGWKKEIMNDIEAKQPRLIIVTQRDALPSTTYVNADSEQYLHTEFKDLDNYIKRNYNEAERFDGFVIYKKNSTPARSM